MSNYQTLKGFRDFLPPEKRARDYVSDKIKKVFELSGFDPIETPTLEYASLLLGKYGNEADKLVYRFMDRGERDVAMRYDQTVPTARVLAQYENELPRFFRRYQMQNVFRADKPQKGRYREFAQCDADIYGSTSPIADAEILFVFFNIFKELGLRTIQIVVNDRQTLINALQPFATKSTDVYSIIQSVDKLDKLPREVVVSELSEKGLGLESAQSALKAIESATMSDNLEKIITNSVNLGIPKKSIVYNPTLARGLDYYTGLIFEAQLPDNSGSLGGGGRYDNLINQLSGRQIPAVGFGLGFDRTVEAATNLNLIPESTSSTKVLMSVFDEKTAQKATEIVNQLRQAGFSTELFPGIGKLEKQFKYANQKNIPLVLVLGPEEVEKKTIVIKDMRTGTQKSESQDLLISTISQMLD